MRDYASLCGRRTWPKATETGSYRSSGLPGVCFLHMLDRLHSLLIAFLCYLVFVISRHAANCRMIILPP
jgi:p-aminobenzoyl-glutamate transporter AbgT